MRKMLVQVWGPGQVHRKSSCPSPSGLEKQVDISTEVVATGTVEGEPERQ